MGNLIFLVLVLASFYGLGKLFVKANVPAWKAWVPIYNFYILAKLLNKPWWWCLIMMVPGVNIIMYGVYGFNVARAYNKPSNSELWFATLLPYLFFVKIGHDATAKYVGLDKYKVEPSSIIKNWIDPIVFAVIAASIIRGYFIEAFTIPTSSLEKSLMVGDFLFVNKFAYGPKIPQTPLSFPFAHHTLPWSDTKKSYLEWIKLPYFRLPGFGSVENNQIVVFNYPDGDTVLVEHQNQSYYQIVRDRAASIQASAGNKMSAAECQAESWQYINSAEKPFGAVVSRPVDKRDHYVKRCVAIAGDKFQIVDGEISINDKPSKMPEFAQHNYFVLAKSQFITPQFLDKHDIYAGEAQLVGVGIIPPSNKQMAYVTPLTLSDNFYPLENYDPSALINTLSRKDTVVYMLNLTEATAQELRKDPNIYRLYRRIDTKGGYDNRTFPHNRNYAWNNDNFGPLQIPKAGLTVPIDTANLCLYQKIMNTYDDGIHQVYALNGKVYYDGQVIDKYTFKQDYYFMMGDNRHNSADSRSWGFVPYDHIVGSPFFVWFSMKYAENNPISGKAALSSVFKNSHDGKFRWDRFLCYVKNGELHSIKIPFLLAIALIWGYNKWNNRRKSKTAKASAA